MRYEWSPINAVTMDSAPEIGPISMMVNIGLESSRNKRSDKTLPSHHETFAENCESASPERNGRGSLPAFGPGSHSDSSHRWAASALYWNSERQLRNNEVIQHLIEIPSMKKILLNRCVVIRKNEWIKLYLSIKKDFSWWWFAVNSERLFNKFFLKHSADFMGSQKGS